MQQGKGSITVENGKLSTVDVLELVPRTQIDNDAWLRDGEESVTLTVSKLRTRASQGCERPASAPTKAICRTAERVNTEQN